MRQKSEQYQQQREAAADASRKRSASGRDLHTEEYDALVKAIDWPRRRRLGRSGALIQALRWYFPATFPLAWSPDHRRMIGLIEETIASSGMMALAMPRGSGKTAILTRAALLVLLQGQLQFCCVVGATERLAEAILKAAKTELMQNDRLLADFPEACYPFKFIEGQSRRAGAAIYDGRPVGMEWAKDRIVFPAIPDSACGGSAISIAAITGALRGQSLTMMDGRVLRPQLLLLDDPQTRESAMSEQQCAERLAIVNGDVMGLAGPGQTLTAFAACTVIRNGDVADQMLDRDKSPDWNGQRLKMVYSFPTNLKLWDEYGAIRAEDLRSGGRGKRATAFYREHRREMDAGASVAWAQRFDKKRGEISAIQNAMNLRLRNESAFMAEYQNEPLRLETEAIEIDVNAIMEHVNGLGRGLAPLKAEYVTAFVDCHMELLFWATAAWSPGFDGAVIDYGTWPQQSRATFTLAHAAPTLSAMYGVAGGEEAWIRAGLTDLVGRLVARSWKREDGAVLPLRPLMIDAGYKWDVVTTFCRRSPHAAILLPSKGEGIGASRKPISDYDRKQGDRIGFNWWMPKRKAGSPGRHLRIDTNFWKSFVHQRLALPVGAAGGLTLWGNRAIDHQLFAGHLCGEFPTNTFGQGRSLQEWRAKPGAEVHWLDCLVGCAVGASYAGAQAVAAMAEAPRKRLKLSEVVARKRRERMAV